jgi:hypothetical protein
LNNLFCAFTIIYYKMFVIMVKSIHDIQLHFQCKGVSTYMSLCKAVRFIYMTRNWCVYKGLF